MDFKKRSVNFNAKEESFLISLVKKYKHILECKMTDMRTHNEKAECWKIVETEFNGASGEVYRSKEVLRKKYDNIKKRVKKKFADERCYSLGTGGGPPLEVKFTDMDKEMKEILGVRIEGTVSEFDGDTDIILEEPSENRLLNELKENIIEVVAEETESMYEPRGHHKDHDYGLSASQSTSSVLMMNESATNTDASTNWAKYTPKMLRSKKSESLQLAKNKRKRERDTSASERVSQWADAKCRLEEAKKDFTDQENKLKLQFMREKHIQDMNIVQQKADKELQYMDEEHKLKMEILQLRKNKINKK